MLWSVAIRTAGRLPLAVVSLGTRRSSRSLQRHNIRQRRSLDTVFPKMFFERRGSKRFLG